MRNGYIGWAFCFGPECIMKCGGIWFLTPNRQSLYNMVNMVKCQFYAHLSGEAQGHLTATFYLTYAVARLLSSHEYFSLQK